MDNRSYYDEFSNWYERDRGRGYHQMINDLELRLALPRAEGKRALEVGCGTGLILEHVARVASSAKGIDLSPGMLEKARARGLDVHEASATELSFEVPDSAPEPPGASGTDAAGDEDAGETPES